MKLKKNISAIICGFICGLLGAGGGMILVPMLYSSGLSTKEAHATSVTVILPLCILSSIMYIINGNYNISSTLIYIIPGIVGSLLGVLIMEKIKKNILKKALGMIMIFAAIRLLLK